MDRRDGSSRARPRIRARVATTVLIMSLTTSLAWTNAHAASTSIPPVSQSLEGPQATLERLANGYRELSPDAIVGTFTADYRFHSFGDSLASFVNGRTREQEFAVFQALLRGSGPPGRMQRADSVGMHLDGIREASDPEHPDSTQHYRVLTVSQFEMGFRTIDGNRFLTVSREHIFHLVRGDAALLVDGQTAKADQWYVRRWIEDATGIRDLLASREGRCGDPGLPAVGPRSRLDAKVATLAIRPLMNPACAKLEVTCDLPGTEPAQVEVYDVSGRRVHQRPVRVTTAGAVTVEAGRGAKILPGVYWVRLSQATRRPSTQMVVVAR